MHQAQIVQLLKLNQKSKIELDILDKTILDKENQEDLLKKNQSLIKVNFMEILCNSYSNFSPKKII